MKQKKKTQKRKHLAKIAKEKRKNVKTANILYKKTKK